MLVVLVECFSCYAGSGKTRAGLAKDARGLMRVVLVVCCRYNAGSGKTRAGLAKDACGAGCVHHLG
jgi:hypothetical protein